MFFYENICENKFFHCLVSYKDPFPSVLQNKCSQNIRTIHRKAPMLESLSDKDAGFQTYNFNR